MNKVKPLLQIIIASALLGLLYRSGLLDLDKIKLALNNPAILIAGFIIFSLQFIAFALRWKLTVSLMEKISFTFALKLHLTGQFFNTFVPGGVGGDVIKALELSKKNGKSRTFSLALTLIDRVVGLYSLILFSCFFLLIESQALNEDTKKYLYTSLILFIISTACLILRKKFSTLFENITQNVQNKFLSNIKDTVTAFFNFLGRIAKYNNLFKFISLSFGAQFLSILFLYIVVSALTTAAPAFTLFFPLACFAFMAMAIPITPGGIGFGQAAFYFIFRSFSDDVAEAAIVGISLMQLFYLVLSLPGGLFFLQSTRRKLVDNPSKIPLK